MRGRIIIQIFKAIGIALTILVSKVQSCDAQGLRNFSRDYQVGFEGAFGVKTFTLSSNIAQINNLNVTEEGGSFGITMGAKALRIKLRQGYFYSSSSVAQTIDEVRSAFGINFYPLQLIAPDRFRVQPYFMAGIERNILKMYGTYGIENSAPINYSVSEAPFLGKISSMVASVSAGVEYRIETPGHFVTLFAEGRYGKPMNINTSNELFKQTTVSNQLGFNVGVGFGYHR